MNNIQDQLDKIQEDTTSMEEKLEAIDKIPDLTAKKLPTGVPFTKGDPRINREGRPEGSVSIVEGIKRKLMEIEPENKKTYLELFLNSYFRKAIKDKDSQLMRDLVNRIDGMPKQSTDITSGGEKLSNLIQINENHQSITMADSSAQGQNEVQGN